MTIIVEGGTGLANAESYITVAEFKAYAEAHGLVYAGKSDAEIEQALRRATTWLDVTYGARFGGTWSVQTQALEWPRFDAIYRGEFLSETLIPTQIKSATAEAAARELVSPNSLNPDVTPGQIKKRAKVGEIEVEYAVGSGGAAGQMPVVGIIDGILRGLVTARSSVYSGRAVRA